MPLGSIIRALSITAVLATAAQAQESRPFRNSWFWGAKVGTMSVGTTETGRTWAPSIGAEWLITRSAGEEDWATLMSSLRDSEDPGTICLRAMVHWRLSASGCHDHAPRAHGPSQTRIGK